MTFLEAFKTPDFAIFTGKDKQTIVQHIDLFIAQCGEVGINELFRFNFFTLSLLNIYFIL